MKIGTQLIAPDGWKGLPKGVPFHFLRSDPIRKRVLLVRFQLGKGKSEPRAEVMAMERHDFETGIERPAIVPAEKQTALPPWLRALEGFDFSKVDEFRTGAKKISHRARVEKRLRIISSALDEIHLILTAPDLELEINRRARLCNPPQNETRFRLWLLTYLCFGQNIWVLLPPYHRIGHWDRFRHATTKFGAPSKAYGKAYGFGCSKEMAAQCVESYLARAKPGRHMTEIYEEAMIEDFRCRIVSTDNGMKAFATKDGRAFPTYGQFRYRVKCALGKEFIQKKRYGDARHRTKIAASKGRFSEEVANLMERIEADAYYVKDRPKGYIEGSTLKPICVVTARDILSGLKLGIGFSFGRETGEAYRMMLFSMAVPKSIFCRLFGVTLKPGEWVSEGLPCHWAYDRGPGARKDLIEEIERKPPLSDMAPSWSGQSKATVESGHPKNLKIEGEPSYVKSNLTPVQMAAQEITRLIMFNNTANQEDRLDPDRDLAFVEPSPNGIWKHYDQLFRNDAMPMCFDEAVRTFLTPIDYTVREDGLYWKGRRFYSDQLRDTGVLDMVMKGDKNSGRVTGYTLDMCVRYAWVEIQGTLIEVPAMLRIRGDDGSLFISVAELDQWQEARSTVGSAFSVHQRAVGADMRQRFGESTDKGFDAGVRRPGRPKRNAVSRQEEQEVLHAGRSRRSA